MKESQMLSVALLQIIGISPGVDEPKIQLVENSLDYLTHQQQDY
ncbi:MAG: hypothetical protein ACRAVC_06955 [Trichormus sp.]